MDCSFSRQNAHLHFVFQYGLRGIGSSWPDRALIIADAAFLSSLMYLFGWPTTILSVTIYCSLSFLCWSICLLMNSFILLFITFLHLFFDIVFDIVISMSYLMAILIICFAHGNSDSTCSFTMFGIFVFLWPKEVAKCVGRRFESSVKVHKLIACVL